MQGSEPALERAVKGNHMMTRTTSNMLQAMNEISLSCAAYVILENIIEVGGKVELSRNEGLYVVAIEHDRIQNVDSIIRYSRESLAECIEQAHEHFVSMLRH